MASNRNTAAALTLSALLAMTALTAGAAPVVAQESGELPTLPAAYFGKLMLADGDLDQPVKITAVADGEVKGSIITNANGSFGGPAIKNEKLVVHKPESGRVQFYVGGEPVTIRSRSGNPVHNTSIPFEPGSQRVVLVADSEDIQPNANLTITGTNSPVNVSDTLTVTVSLVNDGPVPISDTLTLRNFEGTVVDQQSLSLPIGNATTATLTWNTREQLAGTGNITVQFADATATATVTVKRIEPPQIAPPPSGGGQALPPTQPGGTTTPPSGANETGPNGTDTGGNDTLRGVSYIETQSIVSDAGFNMSQVRFTQQASVVSITWDGMRPAGNVTVMTLTRLPNGTTEVPGTAVVLTNISVPESLTTASATVQFRVAPAQLEAINATTDQLRLYHYTGDNWRALNTLVVENSADMIRLQTVTDGFGIFAVSAVSQPDAAFSVTPQSPMTGETLTLTANASSTQFGDIVSYKWTVAGKSLRGKTVTTTLTTSGSVDVTLVVKTAAGNTATATTTLQVTGPTTTTQPEPTTNPPTNPTTTSTSTPGLTVPITLFALLLSAIFVWRTQQ